MKRHATAVWNGSGKEGSGNVSTQSTVLQSVQYSYKSRFEEGVGTNPEELVAAAHAGCFSMKLSFVLQAAGITADEIETRCDITLEDGKITTSHLTTRVKASGLNEEKLQEATNEAKEGCPISKLLNCDISLEASLG